MIPGAVSIMKRTVTFFLPAAMVAAMGALPPAASGNEPAVEATPRMSDYYPGPLTERQSARREAATGLLRSGAATANADGVVQLGPDKYYQAALTGTGRLFTVLAEFGDSGSRRLGTTPGPLHNQLPEPDRTTDNVTIWSPDYSPAYYESLYFGGADSLASFYTRQSAGNYTVAGGVASSWVQVPGNASSYGDNLVEVSGGVQRFVADAASAWYAAQVAAGRSSEEIRAELSTYDVWDRYDQDSDGNFDEPDGYVDHIQFVHAGEGEETGGGAQGEDAIWSHFSSYVPGFGTTGPTVDGAPVLLGGWEIGDSGVWFGDRIVVPENCGIGVLTHEFAHDLFLPDLYNYEGLRYNGVGFWSLMSLGSYLSDGSGNGIGTGEGNLGPWEKLQLGWLDYSVLSPGESGSYTLSPATRQVDGQDQALIVDVPDQNIETTYTTPYSGATAWWTGNEDLTTTTLTRAFDLTGLSRPQLSVKAWYSIEAGYDYLHAEYSQDGGETWVPAAAPLDGSSRGRWVTLRYALPSGPLLFRFRMETDPLIHLGGAFLDDFRVSSGRTTVFADDVESGVNGWAADGFSLSDGRGVETGDRYYLMENRTYVDEDVHLQLGPFNYPNGFTNPFWVEHFPYEDGLLVWMVDEVYDANETTVHPGHGLTLPVDARPQPFFRADGLPSANHLQVFDATFGLQPTEAHTFQGEVLVGRAPRQTVQEYELVIPSAPGIATFDDSDPQAYWSAANPDSSTYVAGHGVVATVTSQVTGGPMTLAVNNRLS